MRLKSVCFFILLIILGYSCKKAEEYPNVPVIKFEQFVKIPTASGKDNVGVMIISFTDGDGDVGFRVGDTLAPYQKGGKYYYNFIIKYFERQKGVYKEITLPFTNNSRIPYLTPEGKNKVLAGNIEMDLFINNPLTKFDTIRFEAYIYDRALNKSNVVTTTDIVVKK